MTTPYHNPSLDDEPDSAGPLCEFSRIEVMAAVPFDQANLICSRNAGGGHDVQLDLDGLHIYRPSSTVGHGHLTVYTNTSWFRYRRLLKQLYKAGVIQRGYYRAARARRATFLRPPHTAKVAR